MSGHSTSQHSKVQQKPLSQLIIDNIMTLPHVLSPNEKGFSWNERVGITEATRRSLYTGASRDELINKYKRSKQDKNDLMDNSDGVTELIMKTSPNSDRVDLQLRKADSAPQLEIRRPSNFKIDFDEELDKKLFSFTGGKRKKVSKHKRKLTRVSKRVRKRSRKSTKSGKRGRKTKKSHKKHRLTQKRH